MTFSGFPVAALDFYDDLEMDNTKSFWDKHKAVYDEAVKAPMAALCAELSPEFGEAKIFRPYRDVRFAKDKTPYKTGQGAYVGVAPSTGYYVEISARGVRVGGGFYEAERRPAGRDPGRGSSTTRRVPGCAGSSTPGPGRASTVGGDTLKTAPRGYPADHPRIDLLRHKALVAGQVVRLRRGHPHGGPGRPGPRRLASAAPPGGVGRHPRARLMADQVVLPDGTAAWVWPLLPTDRRALVAEFEQLSPESVRSRFLGPVVHLTEAMLQTLVDDVDGVDHVALVLLAEVGDDVLPVAIGRIVRYPDQPDAADLAITVKDAWQGRGVATALMPLLVAQRPPGVTRIVTEVAAGNPASLAMLRRVGDVHATSDSLDATEVEVALVPDADPTPLPAARYAEWRRNLYTRDLVCPWLREEP